MKTTTSKKDILAVYAKFNGVKKRCRKERFEMIRLGDAPLVEALTEEAISHWGDKAAAMIKKQFKLIDHSTLRLQFKRTTIEKYTNDDGTSWVSEKTMLMGRDDIIVTLDT